MDPYTAAQPNSTVLVRIEYGLASLSTQHVFIHW